MKSFLFILIVSCFSIPALGQANIQGSVSDQTQNLPSVTVLLLRVDSAFVKRMVTDSLGKFCFEQVAPGHYLVSASMVGYAKFFSQPIWVADKNILVPEIFPYTYATLYGFPQD